MSVVVVEQAGKGDISRDNDGKLKAGRTFLVYEDSELPLLVDNILDNSDLPQIGSPHPEMQGIIVGSYSIREHSDRSYAYEITYSYAPRGDVSQDDEEEDVIDGADPESGVTRFTIQATSTIVDIWKSNPTVPANINNPARTDIGGTLVSEAGYPISSVYSTAKISVHQRFRGFFGAWQYLSNIGKRNDATYHGFHAGEILFLGVNVTQDTLGFNEVVYEMAFDIWKHLRQVPERDEDGNPKLDFTVSPPTMNVFFKQPFPNTTSFGFLPY
jgi:hypothetical protein